MKKKNQIGILVGVVSAGIAVILITTIITYAYIKYQTWPEGAEREKIVVRLNKDAKWDEKYSGDNDILLENCGEYQVDYNEETKTILYMDTEGNFVEKSILTGEEHQLDIQGIEESILYDSEKPICHVKYGPEEYQISFIQDDTLYVYDLLGKRTAEVTECWNATMFDTYVWKTPQEVLAVSTVEQKEYLVSVKGPEPDVIDWGVLTFSLNESGEKIYAVQLYIQSHALGFEEKEKLVEIDLDSRESRALQDLDSRFLLIKCIDNKLYYVDRGTDKKRWFQLYCLNLENGKKTCVYKTDKMIVGIIAE